MSNSWLNTEAVSSIHSIVISGLVVLGVVLGFLSVLIHNELLKNRLKIKAEKLRAQDKQIKLLASNMSDWIWTVNANHRFTYVSPSVNKILGYDASEILRQELSTVLHPSEIERAYALISHLLSFGKRGEAEDYKDATIEMALRNSRGNIVWTETALRIFFDPVGNFSGAQGASRDISERKRAEDALRQMAFNDPLTQIPNRRLLNDRLRQAQAACARHKQYAALFFIDLDNFKYINDNHGHDAGDILLQQVAQRLFVNARESDTVARFGGDEFVIVSECLSSNADYAREQALLIGKKIAEYFETDFNLRDVSCRIGASIGLYLFNTDAKTLDGMIKQADAAMYQAKARGRNCLVVSGDEISEETI